MDGPGQAAESLGQDLQVLSGLNHELASVTLGDLDITLEDGIVAEAQLEGGNGHGLRDGAEIEYTLLAETGQVEKTLLNMLQSIENHLGVTVQRSFLVFGLEEILELVDVLRPDLLRPESTVVIKVLANITDDVGLLQEKTHRLLKLGTLQESRVAELSLDKQTSQALSNKTDRVYKTTYELQQPKSQSASAVLKEGFIRPWHLMFAEPIVLVLSIYTSIVYGTLYLLFSAYPVVFQLERGWSAGKGGLAFPFRP